MLALHTTNIAPGLNMQQANPHPPPPPSTPSGVNNNNNNKPLITARAAPPQIIPMATVPQSQFLIRGGYTFLPPIATPLTNIEGASFSGLAPLQPVSGLPRPITAIPYYQPSSIFQQPSSSSEASSNECQVRGKETSNNDGGAALLGHAKNSNLSATTSDGSSQAQTLILASSSPPPLASLAPPPPPPSQSSPVNELNLSLSKSRQSSLPNSLDLSSCRSPAAGGTHVHSPAPSAHGTPVVTPQPTSVPRLISVSNSPPLSRGAHSSTTVSGTTSTDTPTDVKREAAGPPLTVENDSYTCSRPKSADAVAKDTSVFSSSNVNPYPINALIDVPTSLSRGSRTSSLSSSISSFRFGGSLNKLWAASQLSLSNKVNMKSTGNLNAEAATMPSLGKQYFALGGSLPELSLTSLTRLLPNSTADSSNSSHQPSLFTLVHHPTPLYVYSSQQHLATPFINPNGSITFGSFLSTGSSLCNTEKADSPSPSTTGDNAAAQSDDGGGRGEGSNDCAVKEEKSGASEGLRLVTRTGSTEATPEMKMAATYSPITAHMIQPSPHGTLNRALPLMTLPTFGALASNVCTLSQVNPAANASHPQPNIIPHLTPFLSSSSSSSSTTSSLLSSSSSSSPHIMTAPPLLDLSSKAAPSSSSTSSQLSPSVSSSSTSSRLSPMTSGHSTSALDANVNILRPVGFPAPPEMYVNASSTNGLHVQAKIEPGGGGGAGDHGSLTPTSEEHHLLEQQGIVKREKDKPYKCDHPGCERSFSFPAHLRSHIQQIHISYRPCKCEFPGCGKRFYTPQHLNVHRRVHTGERPFVCPYTDCCKAFTTAGNLKNHIRTHTGERPYACKFEGCTKRFAEMSSLKKHELTHTGEKPYKCRVCGKAFSQAGSRNTHERKHNRMDGDETLNEGKVGRRYRIKRIPAATSPVAGAATAVAMTTATTVPSAPYQSPQD